MKKWVKGKPEHQLTYDGKTYYFPAAKQKQMFVADPAKYVPALGGDCTVCLAKMGKYVPGSVRHAAMLEQRLYLFPADEQKQEFLAHPQQYSNIDLALGGLCSVCKVEMNKDVQGKPEISAVHNGLRYHFPSDQQRQMFLANPNKYSAGATAALQSSIQTREPKQTSKASRLVNVQGKSSCAGCEYGVAPIGSPNELGLAVRTDDGIIVVEDAHKLYPNIYASRFESVQLAVSGEVLKRDGKFIWVKPSDLKVVN
jgi:YHS domain-containing protein